MSDAQQPFVPCKGTRLPAEHVVAQVGPLQCSFKITVAMLPLGVTSVINEPV